MLCIKDALKLAKMLDPYYPDEVSTDILEFTGIILDRIIKANQHPVYLEMVGIMENTDPDMLPKRGIESVFQSFTQGMVDNDIVSLMKFYRGVKYGK